MSTPVLKVLSSSSPGFRLRFLFLLLVFGGTPFAPPLFAEDFRARLVPFFNKHCYECHDEQLSKGGLDLDALSQDLSEKAVLEKWIRIYDRVASGEMPPIEHDRPGAGDIAVFRERLAPALSTAHKAQKGTVLRRLNRREYENTLNDLLGVNLDLASLLPEDGRSAEFDTIGEALGVSASQLKNYLDAAALAIETAIAKTTAPPEATKTTATYAETQGADKFVGEAWGTARDGATVFFRELGYPTGMLREANSKRAGYHRIRVTGYAYQSDNPVIFAVGGTTFQRAAGRPTYGYYTFAPGKPQTVELTVWMDRNYMVEITPKGIADPDYLIKRDGIQNYKGPGLAINSVEIEGPLVDRFPSKGHDLIFSGLDRREIEPRNPADKQRSSYVARFEIVSEDPIADLSRALNRFATAAFRRPVADKDIVPYLALFEREKNDGADFESALKTTLAAMLCSPDFLYLRENPGALEDFALASRLSYFLSRSLPDEALLADAAAGHLAKDSGSLLRKHAARLLETSASDRFVTDFTDSWLDLRDIEFTNPDANIFPEFDPYLQDSMVAETRAYFRELLQENLDASHLVKSDFAMLNWRLASHYGIDGVNTPMVTKVALPPDSPRGGFLTQASVLKVSANGTNTSPVLRGVWINERILGKHPAPPPPGIPGVEPDIRGATTLRELLDKHRDSESCQACHEMIDPPGFALESFDPIGGWREWFRSLGEGEKVDLKVGAKRVVYRVGPPVDSSGRLQDGRPFDNFFEYRDLIAEDRATLAKAFVTKLLTFATGREMGFSDRPEIESLVAKSGESGYGLRDLVFLAVSSEIFRNK